MYTIGNPLKPTEVVSVYGGAGGNLNQAMAVGIETGDTMCQTPSLAFSVSMTSEGK